MRLTIIAVGTRGDVQPMLTLAEALRAVGHLVRFATERGYKQAVEAADLQYYELSGNSEALFSGRIGIRYREYGQRSYAKQLKFSGSHVGDMLLKFERLHLLETVAPCEGADVLICQPWHGIGPSLSEKFRIPGIITSVIPVLPTEDFPDPFDPEATSLTKEENRRSWRRSVPILRARNETIQEWRSGVLGLTKQSFRENLERTQRAPYLLGYSPLILPKPSAWGDRVEVTGYWFSKPTTCYQIPPGLETFLSEGEPPVVVGFGSQVTRDPDRLTNLILCALLSAGRRGVLIGAYGALKTTNLPKEVFGASTVAYDWLLPRAAALVHHGGAGTTAIALRNGLPQVIIPFGWDQRFWAQRTEQLGVSSQPIALDTLTAHQLAEAIERVTSDETIRRRTKEVGHLIRTERSVDRAVAAVERFAG